jgi:NAD(P)-dependent dehydrogenase (short-subunit alcohol dehydrogenase family)
LHATGADLYLAVRDVQKGEEVAKDILASGSNHGSIDVLELHLDSLESVRSCTANFLGKSKQLTILINNAGAPTLLLSPEPLLHNGQQSMKQVLFHH